MKDMTVSKALNWLFIAQILCLLVFIPVVGAILAIIGAVTNFLALYGAGKLDNGYHTAFILTVVAIVVSVLSAFAGGIFGSLVEIVSTVVELGILYFVVTPTCGLLEAAGCPEIAAKGVTVWKINLICTIVSVVLGLLSFIPVLATVLGVVNGIVLIVAGILYLVFLYKSAKAL